MSADNNNNGGGRRMLSLRMLKDITNNNFGEILHSSLGEDA